MAQNNLLSDNENQTGGGATSLPSTRLERQTFDLASVRIQMILGFVLVACTCIVAYLPSLRIGFLLDDFLHVDMAARAFNGDTHDLLANFTSNWAGSDLMKSYRPIVSMSFALDYLIWHGNALGYHLTNIILLIGCCLFVSLITLEITGQRGNRLRAAPAIWAALLFAVYPLHPEATAWIVGRVDLLCTLFYLASLYYFLKFRQNRDWQYLGYSLVSFVISMLSKEMAVSLPFVISAATVLLPPDQLAKGKKTTTTGEKTATALFSTSPFWVVLILIACFRTVILGTLVGGYGSLDFYSTVRSLLSFFDRASLYKLVVPVSEEMHVQRAFLRLCLSVIPLILLLGGIKASLFKTPIKPGIFLIFWLAIALAPTFQIWHIYPNLVGSRLFFLSSVPCCILLALLAAPALETVKTRTAVILACVGTGVLSATFLIWSYCLEVNLEPWVLASFRMTYIKTQLDDIRKKYPGRSISLLSLPRDYKGAGMLTRPSYLEIFCKPPFHKIDISKSFASIELPTGADHKYGERFRQLATDHICYTWNETAGAFSPWYRPAGTDFFSLAFTSKNADKFKVLPVEIKTSDATQWRVKEPGAPSIEQHPDFIRVYPGTDGQSLNIRPTLNSNIAPLGVQFALVRCVIHDADDQSPGDGPGLASRISISWNDYDSLHKQMIEFEKPLEYLADDLYIAPVGESPDWDLAKCISEIGIKFSPGNYVVDIYSIDMGSRPNSRQVVKQIR